MKLNDMGGAFDELAKAATAPVLAFITALLRASYQNKKRWKSRFLEASLLALATIAIVPVLKLAGMNPDLAVAFAVWSGYYGVDVLSEKFKEPKL
jgi:lambda family phage holin